MSVRFRYMTRSYLYDSLLKKFHNCWIAKELFQFHLIHFGGAFNSFTYLIEIISKAHSKTRADSDANLVQAIRTRDFAYSTKNSNDSVFRNLKYKALQFTSVYAIFEKWSVPILKRPISIFHRMRMSSRNHTNKKEHYHKTLMQN